MRKTRLAAAGAAAAIALSGTVAAASTTGEQTVTINVTAAPLTLSLTAGNAVTFAPTVNATGINLSDATGRLTYQNPTGSDTTAAKVTVTRDATDLSDTGAGRALTLAVAADFTEVSNLQGTLAGAATWTEAAVTEQDLITAIARDSAVTSGVMLQLTLTGNAGNTEISGTALQTTLTYTIKDGA